MKKILPLLLIALLVSPTFAIWLPHDAIHALHKHNIEHYVSGSHNHSQQEPSHGHGHFHINKSHNLISHDNNTNTQQRDHHEIYFDISTYFNDFLNVDLQRANQISLDFTHLDLYDIDFALVTDITAHHHYDLPPSKTRVPVDWHISSSSNPLYLSTQRLRI